MSLYEKNFSITKAKLKPKRKNSLWITNGTAMSSKQKQELSLYNLIKPYLNEKCSLSLYSCYIHSYISYANIAWAKTFLPNLLKNR